jgi:hypothetical protein
MDRQIKLSGSTVMTGQLADSKLYTTMMLDCPTVDDLPVPDGVSQAAVAGYVYYLAKVSSDPCDIMRQSLRLAHIIEDGKYLKYLVTDMLVHWSTGKYQELVESLPDELLLDVCMYLHYSQLPVRIQRNRDFIGKWILSIKDQKFVVDGKHIYSHRYQFCRTTHKLLYVICSSHGSNHSYRVDWYDSGAVKTVTISHAPYEEDIEEFYETGVVRLRYSRTTYGLGDSYSYYPSGKPQYHIERKLGKNVKRTDWYEDGSVRP